jgi:hypothetical protein
VPTSDKAAQTLVLEDPGVTDQNEFSMDNRISERIKRRAKLNPQSDYCDFIENVSSKKNYGCICCNCCKCLATTHVRPETRDNNNTRSAQKSMTSLNVDNMGDTTGIGQKSDKNLSRPGHSYIENVDNNGNKTEPETNNIPQKSDASLKGNRDLSKTETETRNIQKSDVSLKGEKGAGKRATVGDPKAGVKINIPAKPKITLRSRPLAKTADSSNKPVQYYDHPNRFAKSYLPKTAHVEKIDEENLTISPNVLGEEEIREKMRQRDIEAHIRGQVALEKEKIQREYRDLLKKLPALQKQERIYEIGTDKEKYHMSKDRLEELEKKRQNRLDNAYEELFVRQKPATVTLPRRKSEREESQTLNLAAWDVDFDANNKNRSEQLSQMLLTLKSQKDHLLKEIESTLSKETLTQLTKSSYDDVKSKSTDYTRVKTKRKRSRDERPRSPSLSEVSLEEESQTKTKSSKKGTTVSTTATSSPSPRKKAKLKSSSRKVLVLQNTSTQTTPKTGHSASTSPLLNTSATDIAESCTCKKDPSLDDLCEIVIKIKEDEKPEVVVNPPFLGKSVKVVTEEVEGEEEDGEKKRRESPKKSSSWRQQLSRSGSSQSTSSTSYMEPPKSARSDKRPPSKKSMKSPEIEEFSRSMSSTNSSGEKQLDPRLLTYIKKLLNMSRASIDELAVSAASDVSTPSTSLVETPNNNPLLQLLNVMKYFNLDVADLQKQFSYASDESSKHYNTSESVAVSSTTSDGEKTIQFKSCTEIDSSVKVNKKIEESNKKLMQYADIAASCTKKISNLTAMIEKVRAEKKKMLQSSPTSSDDIDLTTTSYLQLPEPKQSEEKKDDSSQSQDELDKKLLTIDYNYAEKLKRLTNEEIQSEKKQAEGSDVTDQELLTRLKRLLQSNTDGKSIGFIAERTTVAVKPASSHSKGPKAVGFVAEKTTISHEPTSAVQEMKNPPSPLFLDIPKLPRLEAPSLEKKKKRPPPSKGLRTIAGNVAVMPHELSTIIEADSQLSTKADSPTKPAKSSASSSKSGSIPDILTEVPQKEAKSQSTSNSSDDVSEMDTMETMLISIGMEWAIPTLKKTREALALTSSSSGSASKESGDLSLREFLSKISSSSSKSGESSTFASEAQGMSLIELDNRKTSTPIVNHGENKDGPIFLTDSDLSSVREQSDRIVDSKEKFYDLNEGSMSKTG